MYEKISQYYTKETIEIAESNLKSVFEECNVSDIMSDSFKELAILAICRALRQKEIETIGDMSKITDYPLQAASGATTCKTLDFTTQHITQVPRFIGIMVQNSDDEEGGLTRTTEYLNDRTTNDNNKRNTEVERDGQSHVAETKEI